jgi:hypothetical protein
VQQIQAAAVAVYLAVRMEQKLEPMVAQVLQQLLIGVNYGTTLRIS